MIHLSEQTWRFRDTGMTFPFPTTNILMYLSGQNETITYDYDPTCCTLSNTTGATSNYTYDPGNSSINTGKTCSLYTYDDICDLHPGESRSTNNATYVDSNLHYYGYRYYSPELGRFLTHDPLGEFDEVLGEEMLDPNLYLFCANNPVTLFDILGLLWSEQECRDFFYSWDEKHGFFKTQTRWDAIAWKRRQLERDLADALSIYNKLRGDPKRGPEAKKLYDKVQESYHAALNTYRFFRFMQRHGCKCCALRRELERPVQKKQWKKGVNKVKHAGKALKFIIKRLGKLAGKSIPIGDVTGALGGYQKAVNKVGDLAMKKAITSAQTFGLMYDDCVKLKPKGFAEWRNTVDDHGNPK